MAKKTKEPAKKSKPAPKKQAPAKTKAAPAPDEVTGFFATSDEAEDEDGTGAVHDLQLFICERAKAGGYPLLDIGGDPGVFVEDWQGDAAKHPIPEVLLQPIPGRAADPSVMF